MNCIGRLDLTGFADRSSKRPDNPAGSDYTGLSKPPRMYQETQLVLRNGCNYTHKHDTIPYFLLKHHKKTNLV